MLSLSLFRTHTTHSIDFFQHSHCRDYFRVQTCIRVLTIQIGFVMVFCTTPAVTPHNTSVRSRCRSPRRALLVQNSLLLEYAKKYVERAGMIPASPGAKPRKKPEQKNQNKKNKKTGKSNIFLNMWCKKYSVFERKGGICLRWVCVGAHHPPLHTKVTSTSYTYHTGRYK